MSELSKLPQLKPYKCGPFHRRKKNFTKFKLEWKHWQCSLFLLHSTDISTTITCAHCQSVDLIKFGLKHKNRYNVHPNPKGNPFIGYITLQRFASHSATRFILVKLNCNCVGDCVKHGCIKAFKRHVKVKINTSREDEDERKRGFCCWAELRHDKIGMKKPLSVDENF